MKEFCKNLILAYLRFFAKIALKNSSATIIGVGGSVGKSSTRNAIYTALKEHHSVKIISGNSETGVPLGLVGLSPKGYGLFSWLRILVQIPQRLNYLKGTKYAIVELGIDDPYPPKNMEYLLTIVRPTIAVSLNISATHTEQFEKTLPPEAKSWTEEHKHKFLLQRIAEEDTKIISASGCKIAIYNADDPLITQQIEQYKKLQTKTEIYSFGTNKSNNLILTKYQINLEGTTFTYLLRGELVSIHFSNYLLPRAYQEVIGAALLVANVIGEKPQDTINSLEKNFYLPKGRASIFKGISGSLLFDSSYNSSKVAVLTFLEMLKELKNQTKRPVVFLMGDMRELGDEAKEEHEAVGRAMVGVVDYIYCIGPLTRAYVLPEVDKNNHAFKEIRWFDHANRAGEFLAKHIPHKSLVLIKGSQNTIFLEEAIKFILEDKKDLVKLCRQEPFWIEKKQESAYNH